MLKNAFFSEIIKNVKERAKERVIKYSDTLKLIQVLYRESTMSRPRFNYRQSDMQYKISRIEGRKQVQRKKQVADFIIIKTERICEKEDRLNNLRSLTFAKDDIDKNVKECVLLKTYDERFERSLQLWKLPSVASPLEGIGESGPLH